MFRFATLALLLGILAGPAHCAAQAATPGSSAQVPEDWEDQVQKLLAAGNMRAALQIAEKRLAVAPTDPDALGWHGRALLRLGRLPEAEADFQRVLAATPNDTDVLLDLALLRRNQGRLEDALALLKQARSDDPKRADLASEEGRVLRALGRLHEAREEFLDAQRLAPGAPETKQDLESVAEAPRQEFHVGTEIDLFNYTDTAGQFENGLKSEWTAKWISYFEVSYWDRFGGHAERNLGQVTYKPKPHTGVTVGATWNHDDGVIPRSETFFELDQGGSLPGHHFVRGLEVNYHQQWYWFSSARVLALTPSAILYLPREWMFQIAVTSARSSFPGLAPGWQPSGQSKLTFPVRPRITGNVFFAVGSEDFALTDQIGRFAARTWGAGFRWNCAKRQYFNAYGFFQDRSQARTQATAGVSYAVRF